MRASVIIPTYDRPELLGRVLACLAEQEGDAVHEVLVCDDGSPSDTAAVLHPLEGRIPGLRLLWQPDLGFRAGQARNLGIRVASGDVLIFIDDDVLLPSDFVLQHLAAHVGAGNGRPARQIALGFRHRTHTAPAHTCPIREEMLSGDPDDRIETLGLDGHGLDRSPHPWFYVYSCNFSVTRTPEVVFDEDFLGWGMEDLELGYRLWREGFKVVMAPLARVLHVEDPHPRDPFRCVERGLEPTYDSYVRNTVQLMDLYPDDPVLQRVLSADLRWYVHDATGQHWVKDGHEHDAAEVIRAVRREHRARPTVAMRAGL